jgi:hypothetical protein
MNHNFRKPAVFISTILVYLVMHCLASDPVGYAWPKNDILITSTTPSGFKRLKNRGVYPLLVKLDLGYSIICEGVDGQKRAAFLPLRDRFGEPLAIRDMGDTVEVSSQLVPLQTGGGDALALPRTSWSIEVDLDNVDLKTGVIPLHSGVRYPVLTRSEGSLSIQFISADLTQIVVVTESDSKFLTSTEYNKEVEAEAAREEQRKAKEEEQRKQEQIKEEEQRKQVEEQWQQAQFKEQERRKQEQIKEEEQRRHDEEQRRQEQAKEIEKEALAKGNRVQANISIIATVLQITNLNSYDWDTPINGVDQFSL